MLVFNVLDKKLYKLSESIRLKTTIKLSISQLELILLISVESDKILDLDEIISHYAHLST